MSTPNGETPLEVRNVKRYFPIPAAVPWGNPRGAIHAVDGVSFSVQSHETVSLVGESGCGKTTTARLVLRLDQPTDGTVLFRGEDLYELKGPALRRYRGSVQAVFQDPWGAMNPRLRIGAIVAEPLEENSNLSRGAQRERVAELLMAVGLDPASAERYPHEFSGGMRQRIAIARAISLHPDLVVLDEPVSALDVSVRAQVLNLLHDLQQQHGMSYLMISHNLATVRYLSDQVAVMHLGQIVERAPAERLFQSPLHPYTRALISASMTSHPERRSERIVLQGELPSPANPPEGCRFNTRCPFAMARCRTEPPELRELEPGHLVACHLY